MCRSRFASLQVAGVGLGLLIACTCVAGWRHYRIQQEFLRKQVGERLVDATRTWANEVALWRRDQLRNARAIAHELGGMPEIAAVVGGRSDPGVLQSPARSSGRRDSALREAAMLVDRTLHVRFARETTGPGSEPTAILAAAMRSGRATMTDTIATDRNGRHVEVAAPVEDPSGDLLGAVLLRVDAEDLLGSVKKWTTIKGTGTLALLRANGDAVVVSSEHDEALVRGGLGVAERVSMVQPAALGRVVERDADGRHVLSLAVPVEGSPWIVMASLDADEALEPLHARAAAAIVSIAALLLATWGFSGLWLAARLHDEQRRRWEEEFERQALTKQLQLLCQSGHDALVLCDASGRIVRVNEHAAAAYRRSPDELTNLDIRALWPSSRDSSGEAVLSRASENESRFLTEHVRADGAVFPVEMTVRRVAIAATPYIQVVVRDLTDIRAASAACGLHVLANVGDAVFTRDDRGVLLTWNAGAERMFGWSASEVIGRNITDVLETEFEGGSREEVAAREASDGRFTFEARRRTRSGSAIDVEATAVALRDPAGRLTGYVVINRDITQRKSAERALRQGKAQLRQILEAAGEGIWVTDADGTTIFANNRMGAILGISHDEFAAKRLPELLPESLQRDAFIAVDSVFAGNPRRLEWTLPRPDGTRAEVLTALAPIRSGEGTVSACVAVFTDVTQAREVERQLQHAQKMEAVGRLASGIAHDFGNLLVVVVGCAQYLIDRFPHDDPRRSDAQDIYLAGQKAGELTRQLLAFTHRTHSAPLHADLNRIVSEVERLVRRAVGEDITLRIETAREALPVFVDPNQIEQVILNLALNARDALAAGGTLSVETRLAGGAEDRRGSVANARAALLRISDTGSGMTPEVKARIFEPFFTTKSKEKGTGLGLSVVFGIVQRAGGTIDVESEPGKGTAFTIRLPLAPAAAAQRDTVQVMAQPAAGKGTTILLVEDDDAVRRITLRHLLRNGFEVIEACDADEAMARVDDPRIELVLSDVVMPGSMSGRELANRLHATRPGLPVLLMSGYSEHQPELEATGAILAKPFTEAVLVRAVWSALGDRARKRPSRADASARVLVVDDDAACRDALATALRGRGYDVDTAGDGSDALRIARSRRPGVIVLDMAMPVMSGWEFRSHQRSDPELANIPAILVSAVRDVDGDGCTVLRKPLDLDALFTAIEDCQPARAGVLVES